MTEYPPPPPGSYPPPPPPGEGYPPPPQGYYGGAAPGPTGTNNLAIASLVCSIVGLCCGVGSIIGIVLGVMAMNQVKQTGQNGHGLALAGVIVGAASLILSVIGYAIYFS